MNAAPCPIDFCCVHANLIMKSESVAAFMAVCTLHFEVSVASHFRGGTVSWKHLYSRGNTHQVYAFHDIE